MVRLNHGLTQLGSSSSRLTDAPILEDRGIVISQRTGMMRYSLSSILCRRICGISPKQTRADSTLRAAITSKNSVFDPVSESLEPSECFCVPALCFTPAPLPGLMPELSPGSFGLLEELPATGLTVTIRFSEACLPLELATV